MLMLVMLMLKLCAKPPSKIGESLEAALSKSAVSTSPPFTPRKSFSLNVCASL